MLKLVRVQKKIKCPPKELQIIEEKQKAVVVIDSKDFVEEVKVEVDDRIPCDFCGRKFHPDVVIKHVIICQRNFEKKHGPLSVRKR